MIDGRFDQHFLELFAEAQLDDTFAPRDALPDEDSAALLPWLPLLGTVAAALVAGFAVLALF
jgi:hypothetical protein